MRRTLKKGLALMTAFMFAFTGVFMFNGISDYAYADVGSVADDQEITYDKEGGVLNSMGFDTSKMPDDYDANSTDNPYGEDVMTISKINELAKIYLDGDSFKSGLYGNNRNVDGKYSTLVSDDASQDKRITNGMDFLAKGDFYSTAEADLDGDGRSEAMAVIYTDANLGAGKGGNVYMTLYDAKSGKASDKFTISQIPDGATAPDYITQSQMQITAGDYDNDTVDEIAVYSPSADGKIKAKVAVYDLVNGSDTSNPYSSNAWEVAWNYMLPSTSEDIVPYETGDSVGYFHNFYNNIDLTSGDANNDGSCDLIVSYGSSSTGVPGGSGKVDYSKSNVIQRSIASKSILLYGSNNGQMLRDS